MTLDFEGIDIMHQIVVKFIPAYLPDAQKPYNAKTVHRQDLDIHAIASKAEVYKVTTPPRIIEEGMLAAMKVIKYLVADGFGIKTPLFNIKLKIPGEYSGKEVSLPDGVFPEARLQWGRSIIWWYRPGVLPSQAATF